MSNQIRQIPGTRTTLTGKEWAEGQDESGGPNSSFKFQLEALTLLGIDRVDYTADYVISASEMNRIHTNIGASGPVTLTLSPALLSTGGVFFSDGLNDLVLEPNGTDTINDGAAGKKLYIKSRGFVVVDCVAAAGAYDASGGRALTLLEL